MAFVCSGLEFLVGWLGRYNIFCLVCFVVIVS